MSDLPLTANLRLAISPPATRRLTMPLPKHILAFLAPERRKEWRETDEPRDPNAVAEDEYTLSSSALADTKTATALSRKNRSAAGYNGFTTGLALGVVLGLIVGILIALPL